MTDDATNQPGAAPPPASDAPASTDVKPEPKRGFLGKLWHDWVKPLGLVILIVTALRSSLIDWNDVPSGSMRPTILEGDRIVVNKLAYGFNLPFNGPKIDLPLLPTFDNPLDFLPGWQYAQPQRGDIVTFWNPVPDFVPDRRDPSGQTMRRYESSGIRMVKRVVGLPGDTIWVEDGRLRIVDKDGNEIAVDYQPVDAGEFGFSKDEPTTAFHPASRRKQAGKRLPVEHLIERFGGGAHFIQFMQAYDGWVPGGHQYRNVSGTGGTGITLADSDDRAQREYFLVGDNRDNSADGRFYEQDHGIRVRGEHITGKAKFIAVSFDGSWFNPAWTRWFRSFDGTAQAAVE